MSVRTDAKCNLEMAGLFDKDSAYNGMIGPAVMKLVDTHLDEDHSGFSHGYVLHVFNQVINGKSLTIKYYDLMYAKCLTMWTENGSDIGDDGFVGFVRDCIGDRPKEKEKDDDIQKS